MQLHDRFIPHPVWGGQEAAADEEFLYIVVPMFFNDRLIVVRSGSPEAMYGWCFKKGPYALAAVAMWDPDTQDEPILWHKRVGDTRQAPRRDHDPDYNRPRCVHGSYLHDRICDVDPLCSKMHSRQGIR